MPKKKKNEEEPVETEEENEEESETEEDLPQLPIEMQHPPALPTATFPTVAEFAAIEKYAGYLITSGFLDKDKYPKPANVITVLLMAREKRLPPIYGLQKMFPTGDGNVGIMGEVMLGMAYNSNLLVMMGPKKFRIIPGEDEEGYEQVRVTGSLINGFEPPDVIWNYARATLAKLLPGSPRSCWAKYPTVMLKWRAVAEWLRFAMPQVIAGLYTYDEMDLPTVYREGAIDVDYKEIKEDTELKTTIEETGAIPEDAPKKKISDEAPPTNGTRSPPATTDDVTAILKPLNDLGSVQHGMNMIQIIQEKNPRWRKFTDVPAPVLAKLVSDYMDEHTKEAHTDG